MAAGEGRGHNWPTIRRGGTSDHYAWNYVSIPISRNLIHFSFAVQTMIEIPIQFVWRKFLRREILDGGR
jgi:hypothetical protein